MTATGPRQHETVGVWGTESPETSPAGDAVVFRLSRNEPFQYVWIIVGLYVFVSLLAIIPSWYQGLPIAWDEFAVISGSLLLIGGLFLIAAIVRRRDRGVRLRITKTHLELPQIQPEPVPWSDIRSLEVHSGGGKYGRHKRHLFVMLEHDDPRKIEKLGWLERLYMRWTGTRLAQELDCLEGEPEDVYSAIARLAPAELLAVSDIRLRNSPEAAEDAEL